MNKVLFLAILMVLCCFTVYADINADLASRVIVDMRFDNATLEADYSPGKNHGAMTGSGIFYNATGGKFGGSANEAYTDPDSNKLLMKHNDCTIANYSTTNDVSFCFWIKAPGVTANSVYPFEVDKTSGGCGVMREASSNQLWIQWLTKSINGYATFPENKWLFTCFGWNSSTTWIAKNTSARGTTTGMPACQSRSIGLCAFNDGGGSDCQAGHLVWDNLLIFNKTISDAEISYLFNSSDGVKNLEYPAPASPAIVINNGSIVHITTLKFNGSSMEDLNNNFFVVANISSISANCSFSSLNISGEFTDNRTNKGNFSLSNTNSFEFTFTEGVSNVIEQRISFGVCDDGGDNILNIFISGSGRTDWNTTAFKSINNSVIPSCIFGYHWEVIYLNSSYLDRISNLSLRCVGCNPVQKLRIPRFKFGNQYSVSASIDWDRKFSNHSEIMVYNSSVASDSFYNFNYFNYPYGFDDEGINQIDYFCNMSSASQVRFNSTYLVYVNKPSVTLLSLNGEAFVNNSVLESGVNLSILCEISGGVITSQNVSLSYGNNTLIAINSSGEFLSVNDLSLNVDGDYKIVCAATNQNGSSYWVGNVSVRDTVSPVISWINPVLNGTQLTVNNTYNFQIGFYDLNLFGINCTAQHSAMGKVFSYFNDTIPKPYFFLDAVSDNLTATGNVVITCEVCDDHTDNDFIDSIKSVNTDFLKKNVTLNDKLVIADTSAYDVGKLEFFTLEDRLSYCYTYDLFELKFKSVMLSYKVPKLDGTKLINYSSGHFVTWSNKEWVDFKSDNFVIDKIENSSDYFIVNGHTIGGDRVCFDSVGGLNCVIDSRSFVVVKPADIPAIPSLDNIDMGAAVFLGFLGLIWVALIISGTALGNLILMILACLFGVFLGILLIGYNTAMGTTTILINVAVFIGALFKFK